MIIIKISWVAIIILTAFGCIHAHKDQFRGPAQCLNHLGEAVDWWFIYKENAGMRYIYYDSMMAMIDIQIGRNATPFPVRTVSPEFS